MADFPDWRHIRNALDRARDGLGLDVDAPLEPATSSVFAKYLLLEGAALEKPALVQCRGEDPDRLRLRFESLLDRLCLAPRPGGELAAAIRSLTSTPLHRSRVLDLAVEAALGERLAPETCIFPGPLRADAVLPPDAHRHAIVFAATPGFTHEFYPLAVDAFVRNAESDGRTQIRVLGVHVDWLDTDGAVRRAMFLDPERDRLAEADWAQPFQPDSVQFLCLGQREQELHREISARFDCPQVNSHTASALADDKAETLLGWTDLGVGTPGFCRIEPGDWVAARRFVAGSAESVIKPNGGTEGSGVAYVHRSDPDFESKLVAGLTACWRRGTAIVQQRRDGCLYRDPASGALHTLALRLNLVFDGRRHQLASGFAQIGADSQWPASAGRNGRILRLDEALAHLAARGDSSCPVAGPDRSLWAGIARQAERAAGLFEDLLLVGLDVLLDVESGGRLVPVFLEANSRPAGLSHSRLLAGLPSPLDQAGVGPALWSGLESRCRTGGFAPPLRKTGTGAR